MASTPGFARPAAGFALGQLTALPPIQRGEAASPRARAARRCAAKWITAVR